MVSGQRDGAQQLGILRKFGGGEQGLDVRARSFQRRHATCRRKPEFGARGRLGTCVTDRIPAHEGLDSGQPGRGADQHDLPALAGGAGQRGSRHPPAYGLLPRTQIGAPEQRPRIQQEHRAVAAGRHGFRARCGHDERRPGWHGFHDVGAAGAHDVDAGKRATELFRGADVADHHGPALVRSALGAREIRLNGRTPATGQGFAVGFLRERATTVRAAQQRAAARAGQRGPVAATRNAHQGRVADREGRSDRGECEIREPGCPCLRIADQRCLRPGDFYPGTGGTHCVAPPGNQVRPPRVGERDRFDARRQPPDQRAGAAEMGPQHQNVTDVGVRGVLLVVQVGPVVPHRDQPEVGNGRVRGRPGADNHPHLTARDPQEPSIALGRTEIGGQLDKALGPDRLVQGG